LCRVACARRAIAFVARNPSSIERIAQQYPGTLGIAGDVSRKDDIYPIVMQILGRLGGLDVLINNASSLGPTPLLPLGDTNCEDFETALATNVLGPFRLTKALLGALTASARQDAALLCLIYRADAAITPYAQWGAYGASKAALHHMSRIWNEELNADGVRVVSVDPGDMDTPLHAAAVPDADPASLKHPATAAHELLSIVKSALQETMRAHPEVCTEGRLS
jgi:NAD(P)-dependent dehydrogenase (short-subunit alcohol dehydrogenase family)